MGLSIKFIVLKPNDKVSDWVLMYLPYFKVLGFLFLIKINLGVNYNFEREMCI
jgi:hypothetical protein